MPSAHALLGPSDSERWMTCPGAIRLTERLIAEGKVNPHRSSGAADEGTAAHQVRGDALELGLDAWDFVGSSLTINGVAYECDDEMAGHLQPGMDWLRQQPGVMIVEHRVDLGAWMPGQFGTLDTAVIDRERRRLIVNDLKFGAGVPVDAEGNRQLRIYAIGVLDNFGLWDAVDDVLIVIDQPRAGGLKDWLVSVDELLAFAQEVRAAAQRVDDPDAPLIASEKGCKWCPVKDTEDGCPAHTAWMLEIAGLDDLSDLDEPPTLPCPTTITPERRWYIVRHSHLVEQFFGKLYADCIAAAERGEPDPGSKLVPGRRGHRKWTDAEAVDELLAGPLGDQRYTKKLVSPAETDRILKPTRKSPGNPALLSALEPFVTQDEGRPILVPDTDDRPAIAPLADALSELDDL